MLRWLGLQLARRGNEWDERSMNEHSILAPFFVAHLTNRFEKWQRFDVADRAANLDNQHVCFAVNCHRPNRFLNFVGDVRNDLNRFTEIIAAALFVDYREIYSPCSPVVSLRQMRVREALVMAQIEIGLRPIVGNEDFAMLKRRHRSRIDVDIRIQFHQRYSQTAGFEQAADGRRRQSLTQTRNHATCYEDVFRHLLAPPSVVRQTSLCRCASIVNLRQTKVCRTSLPFALHPLLLLADRPPLPRHRKSHAANPAELRPLSSRWDPESAASPSCRR